MLNRPMRTGKQSGFTLIELLVVMVILAILAAFAIPRILHRVEDGRRTRAIADIESVGGALDQYKLDTGSFPTTEEGLQALSQQPANESGARKWNGPYLKKPLGNDPWGNPYNYESDGEEYVMMTYGADGQPGGEGKNADYPDLQAQE